MLDIYFVIHFGIASLLIIAASILFILQLVNYKQITSYYFIIAHAFAIITWILWLFDIVSWEVEPNPGLRVTTEVLLAATFSFFFYFFYKHFALIYTDFTQIRRKVRIYLLNGILLFQLFITVIHFLGIFPYQQIFELVESGLLPNYIQPFTDAAGNIPQFNNRITTYISHIHQIFGFIVMAILMMDIYRFRLVQQKIIGLLEFSAMVLIGFSNFVILINNVLVTTGTYPLTFSYDFLIVPIFLFLIGFIILSLNYVRNFPSHLRSPESTLNKEEFEQYMSLINGIKS
jgi:hypothetical protein